jgi:two-component system chemotaxis sensor kinase CheA
MATGLYAGTTLADDGSPILLLDPAGLAEVGGIRLEAQERTARIVDGPVATGPQSVPVILFRNVEGARCALRLAVVDRIEEVPASAIRPAAGQLRVQLGETILPLAGVTGGMLPDLDKIRLFRLSDGIQEIGYAFQEVIDLSEVGQDVILADNPGEVAAVTLIAGEPAELIDPHWLFAHHVGAAAPSTTVQPVCRLPENDPWMQNILRPIVEAAGYRVIGDSDEGEADLAIVAQDSASLDASQTIKLRSDPNGEDDSIYRYDRAGLLMALKSAVGRGR